MSPQDAQTPPSEAAVKVFTAPEGMDPALLLKRELAALLALKPFYPKVYDWSVTNNLCFVVMGCSHAAAWWTSQTHGRAQTGDRLALLMNLLGALIIAHQTSLLHLDVKPSNVLIGEDGASMLTDFGVAQSTFASRTTRASLAAAPISPRARANSPKAATRSTYRGRTCSASARRWPNARLFEVRFLATRTGEPQEQTVNTPTRCHHRAPTTDTAQRT